MKETYEIYKCTRCQKPLEEMRVEVALATGVERLRVDKEWENIPNLSLSSREVLCPECFYAFVDKLKELNIPMKAEKVSPLDIFHSSPQRQPPATEEILKEASINDNFENNDTYVEVDPEHIIYGTDVRGIPRIKLSAQEESEDPRPTLQHTSTVKGSE